MLRQLIGGNPAVDADNTELAVDIGVIALDAEPRKHARQEIEELLIGNLEALDIAVAAVGRTADLIDFAVDRLVGVEFLDETADVLAEQRHRHIIRLAEIIFEAGVVLIGLGRHERRIAAARSHADWVSSDEQTSE